MSDVRKLESWIRGPEFNETRPIQDIPPEVLDGYMASFLRGVKTRHGDNYDPDSLHSLRGNIDRYLKDCKYPFSLTKSEQFSQSQDVMRMQRKRLTEDTSLSYSELVTLKDNKLLKWTDADTLLQTLFTVMSMYFGAQLKTRSDHCKLYWGDLELEDYPKPNGSLVLTGNVSRKERNTRLSKILGKRSIRALADMEYPQCCPVKLYNEYKNRRYPSTLTPDSRFYLRSNIVGKSEFWFSGFLPVNNQFLGQIVRDLKSKLHEFESHKELSEHTQST